MCLFWFVFTLLERNDKFVIVLTIQIIIEVRVVSFGHRVYCIVGILYCR